MDLKKPLGVLLLWIMILPGRAQGTAVSRADALQAIEKFRLNAVATVRNYFFYMDGVEPEKISEDLDNSMALSEGYLLTLEKFSAAHPEYARDFSTVAGYWYNIRNRCVHTPKKNTFKRLFEHMNSMNKALTEWENRLQGDTEAKEPASVIRNFLYKTRFLTLLYELKFRYPKSVYPQWLGVELDNYKDNAVALDKALASLSYKRSAREGLTEIINRFIQSLEARTPDPEGIYQLSEMLETGLRKFR